MATSTHSKGVSTKSGDGFERGIGVKLDLVTARNESGGFLSK
jgi:hypothetical protein